MPGPPAPPSALKATRRETRGDCDETRTCDVPGPPTPPFGSQATRKKTRGDYCGRQNLAICRDPVAKLQEGIQRGLYWETRTDDFPNPPAPPSLSQATRRKKKRFWWETRTGDFAGGRQGLAISRDPRHHHLVPKLQEAGREEILMRDKN